MLKISSILLVILLFSCSDNRQEVSRELSLIFKEYHSFKLKINPIEATKSGINSYNDRIEDYISGSYLNEIEQKYNSFDKKLKEIDTLLLTSEEKMYFKVMKWDVEIMLQGLNNNLVTVATPMFGMPGFELMPMNQILSLHLYVGQLAGGKSLHPFKTVKDYKDWQNRLDGYFSWLETAQVNMQTGLEKGITVPKVLMEKVLDQLNGFITAPLQEHHFYRPVSQMPSSFSMDERKNIEQAFKDMIEQKLKPRYKKLLAFLKDEYIPHCRETAGIGSLPYGPETYNYLIRYHTTTTLTADEIHELGLKEVERISAEMEQIKNKIGFTGSLQSFFEHVRTDKMFMPHKQPEQVIAHFNAIHKRMQPHISTLFNIKPKAQFQVRQTEAFRAKTSSAEYVPGTKDGSRPGVFYVPVTDVEKYNLYTDEALFLHEAIPGHHFQLSLQQENNQIPAFMHAEGLGVFVEGWALYCEYLGEELGLYKDPIQYFGMLSMEMHRAIRLVVDTGMHAKGWSREEAIAYSLQHEAESEASVIQEIERYMAVPAQALAYKIGQLKIRSLRDKAKNELGQKFDIKAFHTQVLNSGSLPLVVLENKIKQWIVQEKERS